jgi:predicted RNase H-like HicB family nuclease
MIFDIILEEEDDGAYSLSCSDEMSLAGDHPDEAVPNILKAIELYLEVTHEKARHMVRSQSMCSVVEIAV